MGKYDGYIIFSDLDGTLTMPDGNGSSVISRENINAINYFQENGGKFSLATGRLPVFVRENILKIINLNAPAAVVGGACIYDFEKDLFVRKNFLQEKAYEIVYDTAENYSELFSGVYFNSGSDALSITFDKKLSSDEIHEKISGQNWCKMVFCAKEEKFALEMQKRLADDERYNKICDFPRSWKTGLEILDIESSKGNCVNYIKKLLGMHTLICVGDFENDISMIEKADIGYAVANAEDNVKASADRITVKNTENAIMKIIENI